MKKVVRLTESELIKTIKSSINKHKLVTESTEEEQKQLAISLWNNENEAFKMKFFEALRQCLNEQDVKKTIDEKGNLVEVPKGLKRGWKLLTKLVLGLGSFASAIYLGYKQAENVTPEGGGNTLAGIGAFAMLPGFGWGLGGAVIEVEKIIKCVKKKMSEPDITYDEDKKINSVDTLSTKPVQESKMKKTIRLTESELVNLVQRIIKEDEMMSMDSLSSKGKTVQDIIKTGRFNSLQEGMMVTIKKNMLTLEPAGSESPEKYVIDLSPKKHLDVSQQQTKIRAVNGKLNVKFISGEILSLEPTMRVTVFQP